ncbi:MAG: hypothetical protein J7L14_00100 [Candidatus Diapherotrites archaeon]|nr:hypothetical protein [Candidatus Diapherotrites archaeon]
MFRKRNEKLRGQIFSIDFLIAVGITILAIGLLLAMFELAAYRTRENAEWNLLKLITINAANKILHNEQWTCELVFSDSTPSIRLPNCLTQTTTLDKSAIGIPSNYECHTDGISIVGCNSSIPNSKNVFTIKRKFVLINKDKISKEEFYVCLGKAAGNCIMQEKEFKLSVWRS